MFFTNGGVYGGTPVWLLLGTLYISLILEGRIRTVMLVINFITMISFQLNLSRSDEKENNLRRLFEQTATALVNAIDAMTSRRSYRDPIPQQQVREELVKGSGTQFDPDFARIMIHLLDLDDEYEMMAMKHLKT